MTPDLRVKELLSEYDRDGVILADLLCDRHPAEAMAFTVVRADLSSVDITFGELKERSERFAAALVDLGVQPGDRVAALMGKSADVWPQSSEQRMPAPTPTRAPS